MIEEVKERDLVYPAHLWYGNFADPGINIIGKFKEVPQQYISVASPSKGVGVVNIKTKDNNIQHNLPFNIQISIPCHLQINPPLPSHIQQEVTISL